MDNLNFVANLSDIKDNQINSFTVNNNKLIVIKADNNYYVLNSICPHMGADLSSGKLLNNYEIECPWHHSSYNLNTGKPKKGPQVTPLNLINSLIKVTLPCLHRYESLVKEDKLYIRGEIVVQEVSRKKK